MKADLQRIAAALKKLEAINSSSQQQPIKSSPIPTPIVPEEKDSERKPFQAIPPISVPPNQRKTPTLPTFRSPSVSDAQPSPEPAIATTPQQEDPALLVAQEQEIVQQIQELYHEGPIVDGRLESYHPFELENDVIVCDITQPDVEADGSEHLERVTCEAPQSAYRLCGVHPSGQKWSYPCPLDQLASVSIAIARYEKLVQLLERRQKIKTRLSELTQA